MFWFSKGFAINLLLQSFVIIAMTVIMSFIEVCIAGIVYRGRVQEE